MTFPDLESIVRPDQSEHEREFVRAEYGPGLPYYLNRLDQLMFSGGHVLDAGCGVGQWSLALAQRFARVEAIDLMPSRLAVLKRAGDAMGVVNIGIRQGSIEQLPYPGDSFDAVFCYGVVMFTEMERTLREFFRVLRPGGRVYVCANADGWSRYLIEDRGRSDERARVMGQTTLYNTYWLRAVQRGLIPSLHRKFSSMRRKTDRIPFMSPIRRVLEQGATRWGWKKGARKIAWLLLSLSHEADELRFCVQQYCGKEHSQALLDDAWAILHSSPVRFQCGGGRAVQPDEVESLLAATGFDDFQWSVEGGLMCDWARPAVIPKYQGLYKNELSVWECLFIKPDPNRVAASEERHLEAARQARHTRVYPSWSSSPILSSRSLWTYPRHLLEHARQLSRQMGGEAYMKRLARTLTAGSVNQEDAVRRVISFVQRAIFRDPVSQPLEKNGMVPDALTVLLCARGRCGCTSTVLVELFRHMGLEAKIRQFANHAIAEVKLKDRWVVADADVFKNGVIPVNAEGQLISMEEIIRNPYQLDRFPPTGWFMRPGSIYTQDDSGNQVTGYVDALAPDQRGYVSGYYVAEARGYPPSVPSIVRFEVAGGRFFLEWTPSVMRDDSLASYRVSVGTASRGWSYNDSGEDNAILQSTATDVLGLETIKTEVAGQIPPQATCLFASVTAVGNRIEKEPQTYFWPSEEAICEL